MPGRAPWSSIWGRTVEEFAAAASAVSDAEGLIAVEVNVSCPNLEDRRQDVRPLGDRHRGGGRRSGRAVSAPALWAKLSPNVADLPEVAGAALGAGAEAVTLVNTALGMAIDVEEARPRLGSAGAGGGLSGPAIHPIAVRGLRRARPRSPTRRSSGSVAS